MWVTLEDGGLRVSTLNLFNAGVTVGGNFNTGVDRPRPGRPIDSSSVSSEHVADYIRSYVKPEGFDSALTILRKRHLVVLSAPPGTGRDAAALKLLDEVAVGGSEECHRFPFHEVSAPELSQIEKWLIDGAAGFIAHDLEKARFGGSTVAAHNGIGDLDDAWFARASTMLAQVQCHLA